MSEKLFAEFPPVSTEQWEEVINRDLKGADYDKKLVWKTQEGFNVRPYYRMNDLDGIEFKNSAPGQFPFVRGTKTDNQWLIRQDYSLEEGPAKANEPDEGCQLPWFQGRCRQGSVRRGDGHPAQRHQHPRRRDQLYRLLPREDLPHDRKLP